ncbi:MAG TPA: hypothetical protein VJ461_01530 [Candidatus Nanoarchaeia archaeon]|nr:hypothetical protein [Candidatus Nanoarchaeia archaeon]
MKKQLFIATFILVLSILLITMVNAAPANIVLKLPADGAVISTYTQDFMFDFDADVNILNCSLIIDGEVKAKRNTMLVRTNNKLTVTDLEAGSHTWHVECYDSDFNKIVSEERTFKLDVAGSTSEGYDTIYNSDYTRTYVITPAPGQKPVELPAMKANDEIQTKIAGKSYYILVVKMGISINSSFVEMREQGSSSQKILVGSSLDFDFDKDKTIDIKLLLKRVERSKEAYFTVTPYPGAQPAPAETPTQPVTPAPEEPETPAEEPATEEPETPAEEPETSGEEPQITPVPLQPEPEKEKSSLVMVILIILVVLIIILLAILLISRKSKSGIRKKEIKKSAPKKKEPRSSIPPPIDTGEEDEPEPKLKIPDDEEPAVNEKFDIIKSSSGKKLR